MLTPCKRSRFYQFFLLVFKAVCLYKSSFPPRLKSFSQAVFMIMQSYLVVLSKYLQTVLPHPSSLQGQRVTDHVMFLGKRSVDVCFSRNHLCSWPLAFSSLQRCFFLFDIQLKAPCAFLAIPCLLLRLKRFHGNRLLFKGNILSFYLIHCS
jgi:hypothetical protein